MGYKVNLIGMCFGINCIWDFCWYVNKNEYGDFFYEDFCICEFLMKEFKQVVVFKVVIECLYKKCCVFIYFGCLGVVIGKKGVDIECFCKKIVEIINLEVYFNIVEVCKLEIDVILVVVLIVQQLECCVVFCCVMKWVVQFVMCFGVQGIWINCGGCFGGVEIVCIEWYCEGCVLFYILCVDIDYGVVSVYMVYGVCGVKVWIFKGEILEYDLMVLEKWVIVGNEGGNQGDCGGCWDWGCECVV